MVVETMRMRPWRWVVACIGLVERGQVPVVVRFGLVRGCASLVELATGLDVHGVGGVDGPWSVDGVGGVVC